MMSLIERSREWRHVTVFDAPVAHILNLRRRFYDMLIHTHPHGGRMEQAAAARSESSAGWLRIHW